MSWDRYKQLKNQVEAEERQKMKEAIERLKREDPAKFAELCKRARDDEYDRKRRLEEKDEAARKYAEMVQLAELERARRFNKPVITGLPYIPSVRGMVAFRVWGYDDERGLKSTAMSYHWKELNFSNRVPERHNQSGFYCIKLTGLGVLTSGVNYFGTGRYYVSGFVELLGHVIEHTDGVLRAEVAKLICLFVTSENDNIGTVVGHLHELYPTTPVFVLNPEQLADVIMREVLRQRYVKEADMGYGIGANVEVITVVYQGRWIYPGERGEVVKKRALPNGLEVYDVRLEDGKDCTFAPGEIRELIEA